MKCKYDEVVTRNIKFIILVSGSLIILRDDKCHKQNKFRCTETLDSKKAII